MSSDFTFGQWKVYPADNYIFDGKQRIKLEPKAMELLLVLARANGEVVSRDQIFEHIWKNQIIADHVLYNLIANLRKALEDDPQHPVFIRTVPKKGYRLLEPVEWHGDSPNLASKQKSLTLSQFLVAGVLLVGISLLFIWFNHETHEEKPIQSTAIKTSVIERLNPSIAVLPFEVFHAEMETQYFADGLAEEIIHQLTVIPDLAVIARTSSFAFREDNLDIFALAQKLQVEYLLEGSVRKDQQQLRITVQLIKAIDGTHLWSKVFAVELQDIFTLQKDISLAIVQALLPNYGPIDSKKLRQHPSQGDAYMHFLRGSALAARRTPEYQLKAIEEFKQAVALKPDYALAHVAIAINTLVLFQDRQISAEIAGPRAQNAIDSALEIHPFMPEAIVAQGLFYINNNQYSEAEKTFEEALSLDPRSAIAHHNYGYLLWLQDKQDLALEHFQIALAHNPMSAISNFALADSFHVLGKLPQALKQYQHCIALLPDYAACHLGLANLYRFTQQQELAQAEFAIASSQLNPNNMYVNFGKLIDSVWQGHIEQAMLALENTQFVQGGGYMQLQLNTLVYLQTNQSSAWLQKLNALAERWPKNKSVQLALGLFYYFQGDCKKAIAHYEPALAGQILLRGKFNVMAWGISHVSNLTYCYKDQTDKRTRTLGQLEQQLQAFDLADFNVPGVQLMTLKLKRMKGENRNLSAQIKTLAKENDLIEWLLVVDPAFQN